MDNRLCPSCAGWRRAEKERFCGLCGASLEPLKVIELDAFSHADHPDSGLDQGQLRFLVDPLPEPSGYQIQIALYIDQTGERIGFELPNDLSVRDDGTAELVIDSGALRGGSGPVTGRLIEEASDGRTVAVLAHVGLDLPQPGFAIEPETIALTERDLQARHVRVRLRCTGGLLAPVAGVEFEGDTPAITPVSDGTKNLWVLAPGDSLPLDIALTRDLANELRERPAGLRRALRVRLDPLTAPLTVANPLIRLDLPQRPEFDMPGRVEAMAGHDLYLPVTIENRGAAPLQLGRLQLTAADGGVKAGGTGGGKPTVYAERDLHGRTIEGGGRYMVALDVRAGGTARALLAEAGNRRTQLVQSFATQSLGALRHDLSVQVRWPRTCPHIVTIDFGTTDSAAAVFDATGQADPACLQIGDEGQFVPTVVAYRLDPEGREEVSVGAPARDLARASDGSELLYLDNIKWQLANPERFELPGGEQADYVRAAADYIAELQRRIEGHPDVAGRLEHAFVTRPARFDGRAIGALKSAFRKAGIEPMLLTAHEMEPTTISESWPQTTLGLAHRQLEAMRQQAVLQRESIFGADPTGQTHHLITIDVGGGSCDISAFEVDYQDFAHVAIHERATDGSDRLAGNHIAEWIYTHFVKPTLADVLAGSGVGLDDCPMHFAWAPGPAPGLSQLEDRNGLAVARVVRGLQDAEGPLRDVLARVEEEYRDEADRQTDQSQDRSTDSGTLFLFNRALLDRPGNARALWHRMTAVWQDMAYVPTPITLVTATGREVEIDWPAGGLEVDFEAAMSRFAERFQAPMSGHLKGILEDLGGGMKPDANACVLISGRGSLFPLFSRMLVTEIDRALGERDARILTVHPSMAKAITSMGAGYLAQLVARDPNIRFVARIASHLAVLGPSDPTQPGRRTARPFRGAAPVPGEGLMAAPAHFPPGPGLRMIELAMIAPDETTVDTNAKRVVASLQSMLNVPKGSDSYVLVRAVEAGRIEIGVGFASQQLPEHPEESDFDSVQWLDARTLSLG